MMAWRLVAKGRVQVSSEPHLTLQVPRSCDASRSSAADASSDKRDLRPALLASDLDRVFQQAVQDPQLFMSLPAIAEGRRVAPAGMVDKELAELLGNENQGVRTSAARLAGLWKQPQLISQLKLIVGDATDEQTQSASILSLAELVPDIAVKEFQPLISARLSPTIYLAALEATARQDLTTAATASLRLLQELQNAEPLGPVLSIIMNRVGGAQTLAVALNKNELSADKAKLISRWLSASGHDDLELVNALKTRIGINQGHAIAYDPALVRSLIEEVRQFGDAAAGKQELRCNAR